MLTKKIRQLIPPEHGAWGFLGAAVGAGIGIAPTAAGYLITGGLIVGVFARHAGQLALSGARVQPAALGLGVVSATTWSLALWLAPDVWPWLAGATVLTVLQLTSVAGSRRHGTAGVLVGGVALALVGGGIAATAVPTTIVTPTWSSYAPEIVTSAVIGYLICVTPLVRARRHPNSPWSDHALAGHVVAAIGALIAVLLHLAPVTLACYFILLTARCLWLTRTHQQPASPKTIGFAEIPPLIVLVVAIVVGVRCNW